MGADAKIGLHCKTSPFIQNKLSHVYFTDVLGNTWEEVKHEGRTMFKAKIFTFTRLAST